MVSLWGSGSPGGTATAVQISMRWPGTCETIPGGTPTVLRDTDYPCYQVEFAD